MNNTRSLAGHPVFLVSLVTLVANDWWLKWSAPSALTGKLSDVTGLLVFHWLLVVLGSQGRAGAPARLVLWSAGAIAAAFTLWKLSPLAEALQGLERATGIPMPDRVADPTDLWALGVLVVSSTILLRSGQCARWNAPGERTVLVAACLACAATSYATAHRTPNIVVQLDSTPVEFVCELLKPLGPTRCEDGEYSYVVTEFPGTQWDLPGRESAAFFIAYDLRDGGAMVITQVTVRSPRPPFTESEDRAVGRFTEELQKLLER